MPNTLVCLDGELGAGKTWISKGIASAYCRIDSDEVNSPTFTILNRYPKGLGGKGEICHLDIYRLESEAELYDLGWKEILEGEAPVLLEWAAKFPQSLPKRRMEIQISHQSITGRLIAIQFIEMDDIFNVFIKSSPHS